MTRERLRRVNTGTSERWRDAAGIVPRLKRMFHGGTGSFRTRVSYESLLLEHPIMPPKNRLSTRNCREFCPQALYRCPFSSAIASS